MKYITLRATGLSLTAIILLLFSSTGFAQNLFVKTYSINDGLANPSINDVLQDANGKMWFATDKGISCYDGTSWYNYTDLDGIPDLDFEILKKDDQGNIWAIPKNLYQGIFLFKEDRWIRFQGPKDNKKYMMATSAGIVYDGRFLKVGVGTKYNGFYQFNLEKKEWSHSIGGKQTNNVFNTIYSISTHNNCYYLATDNGVFVIYPHQVHDWISQAPNIPATAYYAIYIDTSQSISHSPVDCRSKHCVCEKRIWLVSDSIIGYFCPHGKRIKALYEGSPDGFPSTHKLSLKTPILPDGYGGIWLGDENALVNINSHGIPKYYGKKNGLISDGAYSIFADRELNLWIGNYRGLSKIISFRFNNYNKNSGLLDDEVTAVSQLGNGTIALGHNTGFSFLDGKSIRTIPFSETRRNGKQPISGTRVLDMCTDLQGNVWASIVGIGIVKIQSSLKTTWYKDLIPNVGKMSYSSIKIDGTGTIIASVNNSLFRFNGQRNRFERIQTDIKIDDNIRRIFINIPEEMDNRLNTPNHQNRSNVILKSSGRIFNVVYIATISSGLYRLENHRLSKPLSFKSEEENGVWAIHRDKYGNVLVGTWKGLFVFKEGKLVRHPISHLNISNPVYFITEDELRNLWFGLNNGIIRWDGIKPRCYTAKDGLLGNETNRAAGFVDSEGRVWIGTEKGVSCYIREKDFISRSAPILELLSLQTTNSRYSFTRDIALPFYENDIAISFKAISFVDEKAFKYNFQLEGVDEHWVSDVGTGVKQIRYSNLSPGQYRFHARAINVMGVPSRIRTSGLITIERPFFQSWWFYFMLFLILILIIILFVSFISKKKYTVRLEKQFLMRTQELAASERELRNIFNTAHDAILIFEPETEKVLNVNQQACEMYGYSRDEFIGLSLAEISKEVAIGKEKINETLIYGENLNFESIQYRKDGSELKLEINATVIDFRGKTAILSLNRDISERKQSENRIKQSLKEKEILLKEIHHRVKNNLQIILSLLDLQADKLGKLHNSEVLQVFQDSKNRIRSMALVHENLYQSEDLARIDASEYLKNVVDYFMATYGNMEDRLSYKIEIDAILMDMDTAIPVGLILTELISNALKHAFHRTQKGELSILFHSYAENFMVLTVSDNGIGLAADLETLKSKSLGLQLVTLLTRQINGTLDVTCQNGTTFKISFPFNPFSSMVKKND